MKDLSNKKVLFIICGGISAYKSLETIRMFRKNNAEIKTINETLQNTSEVIKRLPEFPEIMDKANQALTYLASGQIPQNSNSYTALNTKKSEMVAFRNQSMIGILVVVIIGLLVF